MKRRGQPHRSSRTRACAQIVVASVLFACAAACVPAPSVPAGEAERRAVTAHVADDVVAPLLRRAVEEAGALRQHTAAGDLSAARAAWRALMGAWQGLEVLHLGPAGAPAAFVSGEGLRDGIYAWPQVNLCAVDQQLVVHEFEAPGWAAARLPNVVGLAALEYVLFHEGFDNACPSSASLNADGTWAALSDEERAARRKRYAAVVAADVERRVLALSDAWGVGRPDGFAAALRTAGEAGSAFPTAQQALDELYAALFAVELVTKDKRLGLPAGLHAPPGGEACVGGCMERAESRFSRISKDNVLVNLSTVRAVLVGRDAATAGDGGLDDLLRRRGAGDVADAATGHLDAAIDAVEGLGGSLEDALGTEPARVVALYDAVKLFTDELKSTVGSALGLRVPDEGAGDND